MKKVLSFVLAGGDGAFLSRMRRSWKYLRSGPGFRRELYPGHRGDRADRTYCGDPCPDHLCRAEC